MTKKTRTGKAIGDGGLTVGTRETPSHSSMPLRLSKARPFFPGPPSTKSVNRWCSAGVTAANGDRVVLKSQFCGRVRYTSEEAIEEFLRATNPPTHVAAEAELEVDGL